MDQELQFIQQIIHGDVALFSFFVKKYKDLAFSIAVRILENEQDAEEVVQDAFLAAYRSIRSFKGNSKFSSWLYRIVVNHSFNRLKKRRSEKNYEVLELAEEHFEEVDSAYHKLVSQEQTKLIENALEKLMPEDRLILSLYYLDEQSLGEIAIITGISKENIKMKLHRARRKMYSVLSRILHHQQKTVYDDKGK